MAREKETAARARVAPPSIGRARSSDVQGALCTDGSFRRKTLSGATSVGRPAVATVDSTPVSLVLTCDPKVTYRTTVTDDRVFKALADPTRRFLLDRLFERDGRTLSELESELDMTRFGVMKHLRVLEDASLVVTRRSGREKLHFLNPVPIRLIHDRWIDKYRERQVSALADLKAELEEEMA